MPYHPSQQIRKEHEELFTKAIVESLQSQAPMLGELIGSSNFFLPPVQTPKEWPPLNFNQKLGHLYEDALHILLSRSSECQIMAHNLQLITENKQTLGELDFLLNDSKTKQIIHLELAVKFYLIYQDEETITYPGPDTRDNYHKKLERLQSHQLKLAQKPDTQKLLEPFTNGSEVQVSHLVHGIFFDHINATSKPIPEGASPSVRRRKWLHADEFATEKPHISSVRVIPKQLWLCEITPPLFDALVEVSAEELMDLAQQRCTMCTNEVNSEPLFVVPNNWPNH
jgi:hypothetical protein